MLGGGRRQRHPAHLRKAAAGALEYRAAFELLARDFRDRVEDVDNITPQRLAEALDFAARLRPQWDHIAGAFDVVFTPSAIGEAPVTTTSTGDPMFSRMWTTLHAPCITIPAAKGPAAMPIGVQLVGARYSDARLLGTAAAVAACLIPA